MQLERLSNRTELFCSFFYENPEPMWVYERHSLKFLLVNKAAVQKYGYSEAEFLAMTIADIRPIEDISALYKTIQEGSTGCKKAGIWRHLKKSGELLYVEITSHITTTEDMEAVMVSARDMTEKLALEEANQTLLLNERTQRAQLEQSSHLLSIASRSGRLGGWRVDLQTMVTEWSDQTAIIHGLEQPKQLTAEQAINYYAPHYRQLVKERFSRCAQYGTGFDEILQLVVHDKPIWVRSIGEAEYDDQGNIIAVRGAFQDVNELIQTKDELSSVRQHLQQSQEKVLQVTTRSQSMQQQAQQLDTLAQLTGGIAHDYNNLLTVIISNNEFLTEELKTDTELHKSALLSLTAAQKASRLTQHLLAFGQQQILQPERLELKTLLDDTVRLIGHLLPNNIQLNVEDLVGPAGLLIDKTRFEVALLNLTINAREAMPDGGLLTLKASYAEPQELVLHQLKTTTPYLKLQLTDSGHGMSDEVRQHAFEPYFTTKALGEGYGLGLSMVYGFTQQSHGAVYVDPNQTKGCTLCMLLPLCNTEQHEPDTDYRTKNRLLLVEDDELLQQHLALVLTKAGYQVTTAATADAAPAVIQSQTIDIVLSDIVTPGQTDGIALARWIKRHFPAIKVLLNSGYYEIAEDKQNSMLEDVEFIAKPYKTADLLQKLQSI